MKTRNDCKNETLKLIYYTFYVNTFARRNRFTGLMSEDFPNKFALRMQFSLLDQILGCWIQI